MGAKTEWVRFGGEFSGFLAYPERAQAPLPAIVVIQEAWGVDAHIQDVTRRFALAGYAALAPEVYARDGKHPPPLAPDRTAEMRAFLDSLPPAQAIDAKERERAIDATAEPLRSRLRESIGVLFGSLGAYDRHLPPLLAATKYLREEQPVTRGQKVGSVGFCMGGALSALLACSDPELAGAVIFYGMAPNEEAIKKLGCPLLGLYGGTDARVNAGIPAFALAMEKHGKSFEHQIYEGARHAFFNDERPAYDVRATRDAFARVLAFFRAQLS